MFWTFGLNVQVPILSSIHKSPNRVWCDVAERLHAPDSWTFSRSYGKWHYAATYGRLGECRDPGVVGEGRGGGGGGGGGG